MVKRYQFEKYFVSRLKGAGGSIGIWGCVSHKDLGSYNRKNLFYAARTTLPTVFQSFEYLGPSNYFITLSVVRTHFSLISIFLQFYDCFWFLFLRTIIWHFFSIGYRNLSNGLLSNFCWFSNKMLQILLFQS